MICDNNILGSMLRYCGLQSHAQAENLEVSFSSSARVSNTPSQRDSKNCLSSKSKAQSKISSGTVKQWDK